jgi:hypothetical protein
MKPNVPPLPARRGTRAGRIINRVILGFWVLAVVGFTSWRVSVWAQNRARLNAIAKRGEPVNSEALNSWYAAVPNQENAASMWLKGVEQMVPRYKSRARMPWYQTNLRTRHDTLSAESLSQYQGLVRSNVAALATFREAAKLPRSRYPVDFSPGLEANMSHLDQIRSAADLLQIEAIVACEEERWADAINAIVTMLAAARSVAPEPSVIAQLANYAIVAVACQTTEHLMNRHALGDDDLLALTAEFARCEDKIALARAFTGERAMIVTTLRAPPSMSVPQEDGEEKPLGLSRSRFVRAIGLFERDLRFCLDALTTNIVYAGLDDPQKFASHTNWATVEKRAEDGYYFFSGMLLPALTRVVERDSTHRGRIRIIQTALAVERYRAANSRLPADVAGLVPAYLSAMPIDPFDGKPVRFKHMEIGYVVYSIGRDAKDDGGAERPPKAPKGSPEDVTLIVERPDRK